MALEIAKIIGVNEIDKNNAFAAVRGEDNKKLKKLLKEDVVRLETVIATVDQLRQAYSVGDVKGLAKSWQNLIRAQKAPELDAKNSKYALDQDVVNLLAKNNEFELPSLVNSVNKHNETLLHLAVIKKQKQTVELLLENGASPLAKNKLGFTVLKVAASMNVSEDIWELLLQKSVEASAKKEDIEEAIEIKDMLNSPAKDILNQYNKTNDNQVSGQQAGEKQAAKQQQTTIKSLLTSAAAIFG